MGASWGQEQVHGPANGETPGGTMSVTVGPFACFCMQTGKAPEGTHILAVGDRGGGLVLKQKAGRPRQEDDGSGSLRSEQLLEAMSHDRFPPPPPTGTLTLDVTPPAPGAARQKTSQQPTASDPHQQPQNRPGQQGQADAIRSDSNGQGIISGVTHWVQDHIRMPSAESAEDKREGPPPNSHLEPLPAAILGGRVVEAGRLVAEMEASGKDSVGSRFFFDSQALERIKRISKAFGDSKEELLKAVPGPWHLESFEGQGHSVEFEANDGMLRMVSVSEHTDLDILSAFAALCEVDLLAHQTEHSQRVSELGKGRPDESLWRAIKDYEKEDNIMLASYVDALDEDCGMLWVSVRGQQPAATLHGVPLPQEHKGYRRLQAGDFLYALTSLRHTSRSGEAQQDAVRLIAIHSTEMSWASKNYFSRWRNGWLSRRYFFNHMSAFVDAIKKLSHSEELRKRMEDSPRAPFYAQVKRHLLEKRERGLIGG